MPLEDIVSSTKSLVRPVHKELASLGAKSQPLEVAPIRIISG